MPTANATISAKYCRLNTAFCGPQTPFGQISHLSAVMVYPNPAKKKSKSTMPPMIILISPSIGRLWGDYIKRKQEISR